MEEKKNNKKKILIYSILGVITLLIITLTITYAYWILTREQTGENVVNTACLNISFTGENDITLDKAYPMNPEQLESFLSTETPYHFTIHNECSELASATINLESLNAGAEKQLQDEYINAILYETDYHTNLNSEKKLIESIYNDENKVLEDSLHAYKLHSFTLKGGEIKDFNLLLYMDPETPMEEDNMNASWKGKITLSAEYTNNKFINAGTLGTRSILSNNGNDLWKYSNKLTKIEIQDEIKPISGGTNIYGPFDESIDHNNSIQSYVVCEADDTNCIGYLQGDGGVKLSSNSSSLFAGFNLLNELTGLNNLNADNVVDMSGMFSGCSSLNTLDLSDLNARNVTNMSGMFSGCTNLSTLNLSGFDTSNLSSISGMFGGATRLTELNLSNWKFNDNIAPSFITKTSLNYANELNNLQLENVDTSNVTNMSGMFTGLSGVTNLDLSSFDTDSVTNVKDMFSGMTNLQELNLNNWKFNDNIASKFSNNTMLRYDENLNSLSLNNVDTSNVTDMSYMFDGLDSLTQLNLDSFNTSNVRTMDSMFQSLKLEILNLNKFNTKNVTDMSNMFNAVSNIANLDLSNFNTGNLNKADNIFGGMTNLQDLNISNLNLSNVEFSTSMFNENSNLNTINMTNAIFPVDSSNLFLGLTGLNTLILEKVDTSHTTDMSQLFAYLTNLTSLDLSDFDTSNVINVENIFQNSNNLKKINLSNWVLPENSSTLFLGLINLDTLILENVNTSKVTTMRAMFSNCSKLASLDLSSFDTRNVTDMSSMFNQTTKLQTITFGQNFIHNDGLYLSGMFYNCLSQDRPTGDTCSGVSF